MGFATGFTGGVTLTLSLAYLSVLAHQRSREAQSQSLRTQTLMIQHLLDPVPQPLPPTRSEVAAAQREAAVEVIKQRWNSEIENAVRWVQHTDWDEVRESMEARAAYLWAKATGRSVEEVERARRALEPVKRTQAKAGGEIAAATRGAFSQAKETVDALEMTAENRALDARLRTRKAMEETAAEAKEIVSATVDKGREKAKEIVDKAKNAVGLAGEQVAEMTGNTVKSQLDPVQKALNQRYQRSQDTRTPAEILQERYIPMDKRDNTILRGL
ncbi:hypothetical protein BBK36DRAFT_1115234 [Trichoderma citrinoviride]|uniref:MICOS complex subunit MIC12 n=1 Tax=Trichoderma citrinoviride TaxID=58853 RepID=A0A2T4BFI5_9HYPO|nr:hypothetical protein BBK36DRAFT_1115234 [Trichoderma citrinoviride]PTB68038.1 hypothetical protein BBK36DRAFT_1115234 [Trichoderma citrinoviride]